MDVTRVRSAATARRRRLPPSPAYAFLLPSLVLLTVFVLLPIVATLYLSLHRWNMLTPIGSMPWVGFGNYIDLFKSSVFRLVVRNTVVYAVASAFLLVPLSAVLAAILDNARVRGRSVWRAIFLLPYAIPPVVTAVVWGAILDPLRGPANQFLEFVGLPLPGWLGSTHWALVALVIVNVWLSFGYYVTICFAGLQDIPPEYYEAAELDGASTVRRFVSITLPLLRRVIAFIVVVLTINSLQVFDLVYVLTQGGPANSTNTIAFQLYKTAFSFLKMGQASAMAGVLFVAVLLMSLAELRLFEGT